MAKSRKTIPVSSDALRGAHLFGPPPIIKGEKAKDYRKLLERVYGAIEPADFIEEIWARDLADVTWSMVRLRRSLAALLDEKKCGMRSMSRPRRAPQRKQTSFRKVQKKRRWMDF